MKRFTVVLAVIVLFCSASSFRTSDQNIVGQAPIVHIPPRPADAMSGSEFAKRTSAMTTEERQQAAVSELLKGNLPDFLRTLRPVTLSYNLPDAPSLQATVWVMPDYLAIGTNNDFLRIPLSYSAALSVLNHFNGIPPTRKMVDMIYSQSSVHLKPQPLPAGPQMNSNAYYLQHQQMIEKQRAGQPLGALTSGHKKDVIITNRLLDHLNRVAIYGWHRDFMNPIQPLSTVHREQYEDYSHGIRFVSQTVFVAGKARSIYDLLQDPKEAPVLTYEGYFKKLGEIMLFDKR